MTDPNSFRNDDEVLASIRKNQELMREPEGFEFERIMKEVFERSSYIFKSQIVFYKFLENIIAQGHSNLGLFKWYRFMRSLSSHYAMWQHVQGCQECASVLRESLWQIEIFSKKTSDITEAEFKNRMHVGSNVATESFKK